MDEVYGATLGACRNASGDAGGRLLPAPEVGSAGCRGEPGALGVCCASQQTLSPDGLGQEAPPKAEVLGALAAAGRAEGSRLVAVFEGEELLVQEIYLALGGILLFVAGSAERLAKAMQMRPVVRLEQTEVERQHRLQVIGEPVVTVVFPL